MTATSSAARSAGKSRLKSRKRSTVKPLVASEHAPPGIENWADADWIRLATERIQRLVALKAAGHRMIAAAYLGDERLTGMHEAFDDAFGRMIDGTENDILEQLHNLLV